MIDLLKKYASQKAELLKLEMMEKSSLASGNLIVLVFILVFGLFFFTLLNIGVGFLIGEYLGNYSYGFLILSGFYLLLVIILLLAKDSIKNTVANKIIKSINK